MTDRIEALRTALADRYEVVEVLGEGGMAVVYLARDLKLDRREVALKSLKSELAGHVDLKRFAEEIKVTSSLDHPHVLTLFDSGEVDGVPWFVTPRVRGESLRDLLQRDGMLPVEQAIRIAIECARALDYAHRQGVIHRDVKPENILLQDGHAILADFGIATATSRAEDARLTATGVSIGTPLYMSPEQVDASAATGASDIYALGCVLYEMLVGNPPFTGSDPQVVTAKKLSAGGPTPLGDVRPTTPDHVRAVVETALQPLGADRFQSAADMVRALENPEFRGSRPAPQSVGTAEGSRLPIAIGVFVAVLFGFAAGRFLSPAPTLQPAVFTDPPTPASYRTDQYIDVTPDGRTVIYRDDGSGGLARRDLDARPVPIDSTRSALTPTISPTGREVAFHANEGLVLTSLAGDERTVLLTGDGEPGRRGLVWLDEDRLLARTGDSLAIEVTRTGQEVARWSVPGNVFRFGSVGSDTQVLAIAGDRVDLATQSVVLLDLESGETTAIVSGTTARFVPPDLLFYGTPDRTLMAARWRPEAPAELGSPIIVRDDIRVRPAGEVDFAISRTGTLAYLRSRMERRLVRVGRDGAAVPLPHERRDYESPRISPDGQRFLVEVRDVVRDVFEGEVDGSTLSPLTDDLRNARHPLYTPDGRSAVYRSGLQVVMQELARPENTIDLAPELEWPASIAPNGDLLTWSSPQSGGWNIHTGPLESSGHRQLNRDDIDASHGDPEISPDGRFMSWRITGDQISEVWVADYPSMTNQVRVSRPPDGSNNASDARWSPTRPELYYRTFDSLMVVPYTVEDGRFEAQTPVGLFRDRYERYGPGGNYDVHPDGWFLMIETLRAESVLHIETDFLTEVRARLAN